MNWIALDNEQQLETIAEKSFTTPQVIFKHSTTCSISSMVLNRLERAETPANIDFYYLDLLKLRPISAAIAEKFQVHHESPQILVIKNGECIYDESHYGISMDEIAAQTAS
ncbi:bacillithiol system redox-active protein YtxJ [Parasediminibacterium paludis]|uniref:Bacillithiol system redox-active protein YtxJ n=1 Tax=Parasediminibacterium paludis TaxID=908966 RepID=A0ABV8Q0B6_9BACT